MEKEILTIPEVADYLSVSEKTIRRMIKAERFSTSSSSMAQSTSAFNYCRGVQFLYYTVRFDELSNLAKKGLHLNLVQRVKLAYNEMPISFSVDEDQCRQRFIQNHDAPESLS